MTFDPRIPYDDLPLLPPGADIESKSVLKQALAAKRCPSPGRLEVRYDRFLEAGRRLP